MKNEDLIKELAQPILDKIYELEEKMGKNYEGSYPQIRLIHDDSSLEEGEDSVFTEELMSQVEEYVQEQLEIHYHPTTLH